MNFFDVFSVCTIPNKYKNKYKNKVFVVVFLPNYYQLFALNAEVKSVKHTLNNLME